MQNSQFYSSFKLNIRSVKWHNYDNTKLGMADQNLIRTITPVNSYSTGRLL